MTYLKKAAAFGASLGATALVSLPASAAIDQAVTDAIDGALSDVNTIGAAVLIVIVGIAVWKWARRAL